MRQASGYGHEVGDIIHCMIVLKFDQGEPHAIAF
jgi:hypothetical protein